MNKKQLLAVEDKRQISIHEVGVLAGPVVNNMLLLSIIVQIAAYLYYVK